jgi:hypothetical protein
MGGKDEHAPLTVIQQTRQRLPWCAVSPHLEQYGGEKNVIGDQQRPQSEFGSPTILPHAKQRGGQHNIDDRAADLA